MKIVFKNTNIYPFPTIFAAEKHAAQCEREIYSVFYVEGGYPIYSFMEGGKQIWGDREGNLPVEFSPFVEKIS